MKDRILIYNYYVPDFQTIYMPFVHKLIRI